MLKYFFTFSIILLWLVAPASPRVPTHMDFAGIKLTITEGARKQIQADVDALHKSQTYFNRKLEIVNLYFPIIERVFREENLPDDFKYLTIQESGLIPDAISSSNAVGFWQFKEATATEVGLTVNRNVDERMHITASSHGAARYLKKNNFYFKNWVYALLAYNTGLGGANRHVEKKHFGKNKMEIDNQTHWYVKKFLAYKVAFENEIHKNRNPSLQLYEYENIESAQLKEIADQFDVEIQTLIDYNKWVRKGKIPTDKTYLVIVPMTTKELLAHDASPKIPEHKSTTTQNPNNSISAFDFEENREYPKIDKKNGTRVNINGIPGFIAPQSDNLNFVTAKYGVSIKKFLKYNDMLSTEKIKKNEIYYLKGKKSKAKIHYHVVLPGENAWSISQKYGIKLNKLLTKNRMMEEKDLSPGMVLWLRFIRPAYVPVEYQKPKASNVVVKSIPNDVNYPQRRKMPEKSMDTTSKTFFSGTKSENTNASEEFLFEETSKIVEPEPIKTQPEPKTYTKKTEFTSNPPNDLNDGLYHIVKPSETLFSISRKYNVSVDEIKHWNKMGTSDILQVGQEIAINNPPTPNVVYQKPITKSTPMYYTVKSEDTLYGIARTHNISVKELMKMNNMEDFNIKEGEVLKVRMSE